MKMIVLCVSPWQNVINSSPCLCWGVIGLVALYLVLKYIVQPLIANSHERKSKEKAIETEKF